MMKGRSAVVILGVLAAILVSSMLAYRLGQRRRAAPVAARVQEKGTDNGCLDLHSAANHTGENSCVSGRVLRVFTSRSGNTFLDFCQDYRQCPFTSVIFASDRSRFGNLASLEGREVEIRGEITSYNGRAEIVIQDPSQIRLGP